MRPSEQAADLAHRMHHAKVTRVVVTRPDGTLVGLFFADDLVSQELPGRQSQRAAAKAPACPRGRPREPARCVRPPSSAGQYDARFLVTAEEFGAAEAPRIGLVQEVVPTGSHISGCGNWAS